MASITIKTDSENNFYDQAHHIERMVSNPKVFNGPGNRFPAEEEAIYWLCRVAWDLRYQGRLLEAQRKLERAPDIRARLKVTTDPSR